MTVAGSTARRAWTREPRQVPARARMSRRKRLAFFVAGNLIALFGTFVVVEVAFRLFARPRYWMHTERLMVGSGQTNVGRKWWPNTTYIVDGTEFRTVFRTDAMGYRAAPRPVPPASEHAYRLAFVGDSFTEAMQVSYEATFCDRLEALLNQDAAARPRVCINYGISNTGILDYWHRIVHDVLTADPPDALVLCVYPGNDFQPPLPADGFGPDGRPLRDYFHEPGWGQHLIAWVNLHTEFGFFLQRSLLSWGSRSQLPEPRLTDWWTDPSRAADLADEPVVRRYRSLLTAIDEECRRRGTKLIVLVVGPVANYSARDGQSPLGRILASWGVDAPVIDVAMRARARKDWPTLVFSFDGHLNELGHDYLANQAIGPLRELLHGQGEMARRVSCRPQLIVTFHPEEVTTSRVRVLGAG